MGSRIELQTDLMTLIGSSNVYYQPPESIKMKYPAIVYSLDKDQHEHADNRIYLYKKRYTVTVIDKDPESEIPDKVLFGFEYCSFDRHYIAENLHHFVYTLYY